MRQTLCRLLPALAVVSATLLSGPANAATGNVQFLGTVTAGCTLLTPLPGVMLPNALSTELSSVNGTPATIQALATGTTFKVSTSTPTTFASAPEGGDTAVTFSTSYSGAGATNFGAVSGDTDTTLNLGTTAISVNLAATKTSGVFPGGQYTAEVTVTCE